MAYSDRELLARVIKCEAGGEGDNGMRAVATVIMNRIHAPGGEYARIGGGDINRIVFQPRQFDCAATSLGGKINPQTIYSNPPEPVHYEIADWALGGGRLGAVGECLWFFNPYGDCRAAFPNQSGTFHTRVNLHCFYRPTDYYSQT